jgi:4-amino-4-deoxy-L-arabinose transferase-like glycosyltransferase
MTALWNGRARHYLLLLAAGLILFVNNLGGPSLWDLDEGRNAGAALEMLESGNFVVPTFNAHLRVDKPALLYWLQIASFHAFGVNEFAARLPSALAALAILFLCYELGRALFSPSTALLGGLILGSTALAVGTGRFANPDSLLNFCVTGILTLFWRGCNPCLAGPSCAKRILVRPASSSCAGMGVLLGLGALAKGPVGILLPTLVVVAFLAWERRLALLRDRRWWLTVLGLTLVALPWYVWVAVETRGTFLRGFLWEHNLSRFFNAMDQHTGPPFYYFLVLLVGTAPWSIFVFIGTWYGIWSMVRVPWPYGEPWWKAAGEHAEDAATPAQGTNVPRSPKVAAYRFLGVWLACYLVFFSIAATKLPNYLLPAAVPFALLSARFLDRWRLGEVQPPRWVMTASLACLAGGGVATGVAMAVVSRRLSSDLPAAPSGLGLESCAFVGLVPVWAALGGLWYLRRGRTNGVVACLVMGAMLFLGSLGAWAMPAWNRMKAPRSLALDSGAGRRDQDIRVGGYQMEHLPSLNFYVRREVLHLSTDSESVAFLHYQVPVYLFLPARLWDEMKDKAPAACRLVAHYPDFYRHNDIVVVTNLPAPPAAVYR